ncbi:MAG: stage 0 sporulation family protein [Clostridiales bacterium]
MNNNEINAVAESCCCKKAQNTVENKPLYNEILAQNLSLYPPANGCMVCGAELSLNTPKDDRIIIEASTKGILGTFYCIVNDVLKDQINLDDIIIVNLDDMTEVATVIETNQLVSIKRQRLGLCGEPLPVLLRKVTEEDLLIVEKNLAEEKKAHELFRAKAQKYNLNMKLVDIHYQFDRNKLYFFYTADGRVDFRELAKDLAGCFRTRIELRQIGVRDEAKRIGGLGTCGREFCCSKFLNNFKKITTQLASEQNLASSFSKLSGPCGKLKCCLSFEHKDASLIEELQASNPEQQTIQTEQVKEQGKVKEPEQV